MAANTPGQISPDGAYYWDGQQWVSTLSHDGAHRWNGSAWVPAGGVAAPGAPATAFTPAAPPPPASYSGPAIHPAATPYGASVAAQPRSGLAYQFGGVAAWSLAVGLASILLPIVTSLTTGSTYYFFVLPLFGIYRGFVAIRLGRTAGGAVGIALNVLGGLLSLIASGLILR